MPSIDTKHFGMLTYDPARVLTFPAGLPGYPTYTQYTLLSDETSDGTFYWLQSVEDGEIVFTLMDVYRVLPDYNPLVDPEELGDLGDITEGSLEIYNVAVIPEDIQDMRVNLRAPVVINNHTKLGKQMICLSEEYPIRYMIAQELQATRNGVV